MWNGARRAMIALAIGLASSVPLWPAAASGATPEAGGWSPVLRPRDATNPTDVAVAVDARGDAAVGWIVTHGGGAPLTEVRVATRRGPGGAWSARTLRSARRMRAGGMTLAIAPTGEVTVAWIDELAHAPNTVRAAFRSPTGRWSAIQRVGVAGPFAYAYPRVAAPASGTVALVYNAHTSAAPGMAVAWRRPGRPFGAPAPVPGGVLSEPALAFDRAGTAFLAGTAQCDNESQSHGVLLTAPAATHRFGAPRTITPRPATEVRLALTATGQGIAAWLGAGCSTTELLGGPVSAARIDGSAVRGPVVVSSGEDNRLEIVAASGGVDLSWVDFTGKTTQVVAHASADGAFSAPAMPADGWVPIAGDAAGDQVLQTAVPYPTTQAEASGARAAGTQSVQRSPIGGPAWWVASGSVSGRGLIEATSLVGGLRVATWRP